MELKEPTTWEEQIEILRSRNCIIDDKNAAETFLRSVNYYRLTAYFLPFKNSDGTYHSNITFSRIIDIYTFDQKLRMFLFSALEEIEIYLRTNLAYFHAHRYGSLGYMHIENFNSTHKHDEFLKHCQNEINSHSKQLFVKHHISCYDGQFPLWVMIELFTFGQLSKFFSDMHTADRKQFSCEIFHQRESVARSWVYCLSLLRNYCAHYSRLYYNLLPAQPRVPSHLSADHLDKSVFGYMMVLKHIYPSQSKWNHELLFQLGQLIRDYGNSIELVHIGFPPGWMELLRKG